VVVAAPDEERVLLVALAGSESVEAVEHAARAADATKTAAAAAYRRLREVLMWSWWLPMPSMLGRPASIREGLLLPVPQVPPRIAGRNMRDGVIDWGSPDDPDANATLLAGSAGME
jgi:hypothetical protein